MKIVADTNVLVSGLLSPSGPPAKLVSLIFSGHLTVCCNLPILLEYEIVLKRPRFRFPLQEVEQLLDYIQKAGQPVSTKPLPTPLPDPADEMLLETALACGAEFLVTGNPSHFPQPQRCGVLVLTPREAVDHLRDR